METLKDEDIQLRFLAAQSVYVPTIGYFHAPTLNEIISLTDEEYSKELGYLLLDNNQLDSENYIEINNYELMLVFLQNDIDFRNTYLNGLRLHFDEEPLYDTESGLIYFNELNEDGIYTEERFNYVRNLVRIANHIAEAEKEEDVDYASEKGRILAEKQRKLRARLSKLKKPKSNLHSVISAVGAKSNSFSFIEELNIYQLYDRHSRLRILDNYHYTMQGIYAGTIDGKDMKMDDIDWANIIHIKK